MARFGGATRARPVIVVARVMITVIVTIMIVIMVAMAIAFVAISSSSYHSDNSAVMPRDLFSNFRTVPRI